MNHIDPENTSSPITHHVARRNGHIARLPKQVRDRVNQMLLDGMPYAEIIKNLGEAGKHLHISNLSRWKKGGYQDWLKDRQQIEAQRTLFDGITELVAKTEVDELPSLTVKLLAARVFGVLTQLTPTELHENATSSPNHLPRLLSLVPKLSHEALATRKYRHALQTEGPEQ